MVLTLWPLPWPWGQLLEDPILASSIFFGMLVVVIGVLYVVGGILSSERGPLHWLISRNAAGDLTTALVIGLALGLGTSLVFDLVPGSIGLFIPPDNLLLGLAMGLGCGILFGCALGRIGKLPRGIVLGAAIGLIVGLAAFRRIFGPTAGFGPETDQGVGTEVGLAFGLIGGLAGALVGLVIGNLRLVSGARAEGQRHRNWLAVGMLIGAAVALVIGLVGLMTGHFTFTLPYYGGITDCSRPTGCAALPPAQLGLVYGLGLFTLGGGLMGGLASAPTRFRSWAGRVRWSRVIAIVALTVGLAAGLDTGLQHRLIGGLFVPAAQSIDPAAGGIGLAVGLAAGLALGIVCALLMHRTEQPSARHALLVGTVVFILGAVMWSLTMWWVPLTYINIP